MWLFIRYILSFYSEISLFGDGCLPNPYVGIKKTVVLFPWKMFNKENEGNFSNYIYYEKLSSYQILMGKVG